MTTSARPALPRRNPRLSHLAAGLCLATAALAARADIAVLREKGPHSGSAFSNPGLVADAPAGLKVAMKTADVRIHLRPGDGDSLKADVTADFEIEDSSPTELAGQLYLVGFPVTGLSSKIVTIDNFAVKVGGKEPATVLRRSIGIRFNQTTIQDTPVAGNLERRFELKERQHAWSIDYKDDGNYRASYIWQQAAVPGRTVHVHVAYTITLRPQSIHYSKSYENDESDDDVIPFRSLGVRNWDERYYFFDYVLRSGATWDGPIGRETIAIRADPSLGLNYHDLLPKTREQAGRDLEEEEEGTPRRLTNVGEESDSYDPKTGTTLWILKNSEPCRDLLLAIPVTAQKRRAEK